MSVADKLLAISPIQAERFFISYKWGNPEGYEYMIPEDESGGSSTANGTRSWDPSDSGTVDVNLSAAPASQDGADGHLRRRSTVAERRRSQQGLRLGLGAANHPEPNYAEAKIKSSNPQEEAESKANQAAQREA